MEFWRRPEISIDRTMTMEQEKPAPFNYSEN
jgi:hypothetical protein